MKLSIGHANFQLLQRIGIVRVEVETHLGEPFEVVRGVDFLVDQSSSDVSLVHMFDDLDRQTVPRDTGV